MKKSIVIPALFVAFLLIVSVVAVVALRTVTERSIAASSQHKIDFATEDATAEERAEYAKNPIAAPKNDSAGPLTAPELVAGKPQARQMTEDDGLLYWPSEKTTGVPQGVALTVSEGITVKQDNTVIEGKDVRGCITIKANNTIIKNTRVINIPGRCTNGVVNTGYNEYKNTQLVNVEIDGANDINTFLIGHGNFSCLKCNLHGGFSGAHPRSNTLIQDSFIHTPASGGSSEGKHVSGVGFHGGKNFKLLHNRIECGVSGCSAALSLYGNFEQVEDVLIADNYFAGGGYCTYGGSLKSKPFPYAKNTMYINNAFQRIVNDEMQKCGRFGPVASYEPGNGNYWGGNYWMGEFAQGTPYDPKRAGDDH